MEWDQDLPPSPFIGVQEQEWDGEHTGEQGVAELAEPVGEVALPELGPSRLALPATCASLELSTLAALAQLSSW